MEYEVKKLLSPNLYTDIFSITEGSTDFSRFENKTVLVTGAAELLGIYLVSAFLINNDINSSNTRLIALDSHDDIFRKYGKLTNRPDVVFLVSRDYSALKGVSADYVIHTESVRFLESDLAAVNLLEFVEKTNARAVLNSYRDIYGDVFNGKDKICEDDMGYLNPAKPESRNIQAQRAAESLAVWFCENRNTDLSLCRSSLIYGATEFDGESKHVEIITRSLRGQTLNISPTDGIPQSYCYVTDAAEALLTVLLNGEKGEIYNISSGYISSPSLLAGNCVKIFPDKELKVAVNGNLKPVSPISPTVRVLDNSKLCALGFTPRVSVAGGIVRAAKIISEVM